MMSRFRVVCAVLGVVAWMLPLDVPTAAAAEPAPAPSPSSEKSGGIDLRPKFVEGRDSRYTMRSASKSTQEPVKKSRNAPAAVETRLEQEIGLLVRTTKVNEDGSAELQVVYESLKIRGSGDGYELDFDSTKPERQTDVPGDFDLTDMLLRNIVGTTLNLKVDANGNISSVTGGGALGALAKSPFVIDGDIEGLLGQTTGGGESGVNWLVGSTSTGNADRRRVGEQWTHHDRLAGTPIGAFDMLTTHTLKRVRAHTAEVEFVSVLESAGNQGNAGVKSNQVEQARADGKYLWDTEKGELDEMTSTQTSTMTVGEGEDAAKLTSEQKVRVERKD